MSTKYISGSCSKPRTRFEDYIRQGNPIKGDFKKDLSYLPEGNQSNRAVLRSNSANALDFEREHLQNLDSNLSGPGRIFNLLFMYVSSVLPGYLH